MLPGIYCSLRKMYDPQYRHRIYMYISYSED